ncbi:MAG: hypothetical protein C4291_15085, partial [Candidatus Dadabacteria bacterium]
QPVAGEGHQAVGDPVEQEGVIRVGRQSDPEGRNGSRHRLSSRLVLVGGRPWFLSAKERA